MADPSNNYGFFGPNYDYIKHIRSPSELQVKVSGNMWEFGNDIAAIGDYIAVLIAGPSAANIYPERPLGMSYMQPTNAKCTDINADVSGTMVQRSIFVNNIPLGNIPLLSAAADGQDFTMFRGLIPGVAQNLEILNPASFTRGLLSGGAPPCMNVTLPTIDASGIVKTNTGYVTIEDLSDMDPCAVAQVSDQWRNFDKRNYFNGKVPCADGEGLGSGSAKSFLYGQCSCSAATEAGSTLVPPPGMTSGYEGFTNINNNHPLDDLLNEKNFTELWLIIISIIGLYILLKVCSKQKFGSF